MTARHSPANHDTHAHEFNFIISLRIVYTRPQTLANMCIYFQRCGEISRFRSASHVFIFILVRWDKTEREKNFFLPFNYFVVRVM